MFASETLPDARAGSLTSVVNKLLSALIECSDEKFTERLAVVNKLLEVWSEGEDVDLRCNEPPQLVTAQLSAADVQILASNKNAPGVLLWSLVVVRLMSHLQFICATVWQLYPGFVQTLESPGILLFRIPGPGKSWKKA